ncbi:malate:quinone oxidoreductase, partial [Pseudomonas aeruginosa]|uniref:malate:quinone oxidoreductase n=1 Tax=Pseudomonas aeruginosa TaxID=287 RepID=UPI00396AA0BA
PPWPPGPACCASPCCCRAAPSRRRWSCWSPAPVPPIKDKVATPEWQARLKEIVPSYGRKLNNDIELTNSTRAWSSERLQLIHVPVQPEA